MKDIYKTKDLAESSYLLAKEKKLIDIERIGKTCWFIFEDKPSCQNLANEFWFGNSTIHAKTFWDASLTLKHRIFT